MGCDSSDRDDPSKSRNPGSMTPSGGDSISGERLDSAVGGLGNKGEERSGTMSGLVDSASASAVLAAGASPIVTHPA
jgi:hypothetical protein